jgi:hypothetical protein
MDSQRLEIFGNSSREREDSSLWSEAPIFLGFGFVAFEGAFDKVRQIRVVSALGGLKKHKNWQNKAKWSCFRVF